MSIWLIFDACETILLQLRHGVYNIIMCVCVYEL